MSSSRPGIGTSSARNAPGIAQRAWCDEAGIHVELTDGRIVSMPIPDWLRPARPDQRANVIVRSFGTSLYWPALDEEMGVNTVLGVTEDAVYAAAGFESGVPEE